jgi:hypothetical protein
MSSSLAIAQLLIALLRHNFAKMAPHPETFVNLVNLSPSPRRPFFPAGRSRRNALKQL